MEKVIVKVFDRINGKFRASNFKAEEISTNAVKINGISYARKGEKVVGRVIIINISDDKKHMFGRSFPIYA